MGDVILYITYIVPFCAIWFFLHKSPGHYYIRKGLVYTVLAIVYFFFEKIFNDVRLSFDLNKIEFPGLISGPISTIYHLYFFLLLTSDTFSDTWFGKTFIKIVIISSLLILVTIDYFFQTVVFSYIYTNVVVIMFSIIYFKIRLQDFSGKAAIRPGAWIIIGYFIFSISLIPVALVVEYVTKGIERPIRLVGFYSILFEIIMLLPQVIFYTLLSYGCYKYWLESRKAYASIIEIE